MDYPLKSFNPNKYLKEEFVSNLTGSSLLEIAALSTIVPVLILLRHLVNFKSLGVPVYATGMSSKKDDDTTTTNHKSWRVYVIMTAVDFLFIVLPILLFFTVLSEWSQVCAVLLVVMLLLFITIRRFSSSSHSFENGQQSLHDVRKNISSYRVSMMVVTCLCILAVDFKIFPRRYAKTEAYGTSLMDLGVGSFVLANSLVSRQARNLLSVNWKTAVQSTSPLIILGLGRLIFTTGVNYQVHVGEYGVHWNFFFTLAAVSILTTTIKIHPKFCGILGSSVIIGYQAWLVQGLNDYLLSNDRTSSIISQNKEGIFSVFGYWGLYLIGVFLGNYLFFGYSSSSKTQSSNWTRIRVWILSILFWSLTLFFEKHVERVSRRMCNLAYASFVFAQNFQVLAILMLSDFIPGLKTSVLEEAINRNLLGVFLLANVLTGLINLQFDTISASALTGLAILVSYAFVLSLFAGLADYLGVKMKFW